MVSSAVERNPQSAYRAAITRGSQRSGRTTELISGGPRTLLIRWILSAVWSSVWLWSLDDLRIWRNESAFHQKRIMVRARVLAHTSVERHDITW